MSNKAFSLEELAKLTHSRLVGKPDHLIKDVADLESATSEDASFLSNPRYEQMMKRSKAGVIFVSDDAPLTEGRNFLIAENPSRAFQQTVEAFCGDVCELTGFAGIHPTAVVHESAAIAHGVQIGPHAVIDKGVKIGEGSFIGAGCYIGPSSQIGVHCVLHPRVTIRERTQIGDRVIIQPGAVIGSCGFGYTTDAAGRHTKLNQVGIVILEDDVEIGANTTIDRSRFKATKIGKGSKIDNLVQIGHGVEVGEHNIIVSQTGLAGSTVTGKHVVFAGQVAVAGHLKIADGVMIAGKSGLSKSIDKPGKYGGIPVMPIAEYNRNAVFLRNIETYVNKIKELQGRVETLEQSN